MEAVCGARDTNLQVDSLVSWIEVDEKTPVTQHLSKEDIAASVKNGTTADELGHSDR
jgi:hypothetical protein